MEALSGGFDDRKEAARSPESEVRRWILELDLADKREKNWRKNGNTIYNRYRGIGQKENSFNILWANTEVLRPALYNSTPKPDVRRRFRDSDQLGKAVSEVLERSLTYAVDAADFDGCIRYDILDMLLPGRGVSRIRYIPSFKDGVGDEEELDYEQVEISHVDWEDYRQGAGKTWPEVPWVAYKHRLKKDDVCAQFGEEIAEAITYDQSPETEDKNKNDYADLEDVFKTADFWEIWDKTGEKVFFLQKSHKKSLIYPLEQPEGEPPLDLKGFFPSAEPIRGIEDSSSQLPTPLYDEYRAQAEELDRISTRINKLIERMKLRGLYDSTMSEIGDLVKGGDGDMIAVTNAAKFMAMGGQFDKMISWMPVDMAAKVLNELYKARDMAKQVIYEITGIADIVRGVTAPSETLGAQQIKAKFASLRIQRLQREVQRYIRDLIRIMAEVIGGHFQVETLAKMTGLNFPMQAQKVEAQMLLSKYQAAQQTGQQIPIDPKKLEAAQAMLDMPTWEDIKAVLSSDIDRQYRVDIETDSTVSETLQSDMNGLKEVIGGLVQFWQGVGPAVQAKAISMQAVKAISLQICRRARLGLEVEDALEQGMQEPQPQADPNAQADQMKAQQAQQQAQHDQQIAQRQQAHEEQIAQREMMMEQQKAQVELSSEQRRMEMEAHFEERRLQMEAQAGQHQAMLDMAFAKFKALLDAQTKIEVAEISAGATLDAAQVSAAQTATQQ